jgi:hypothetical protein
MKRPDGENRSTLLDHPTRAALVVGLALVLALLLDRHVQWMNGMLWIRPWCQRSPLWVVPLFLACCLPLVGAVWLRERKPGGREGLCVPALALTCFLLMYAATCCFEGAYEPARLPRAIEHEYVTSYFLDASQLREIPDFLARFPELMDSLHLHSENKPPGAILYFMGFIEAFGYDDAASLSGLGIGVLAALTVVSTWWMVITLTESRDAAFAAAVLVALCPSLVLSLPLMDQVMPNFTCLLVASWTIALRRNSPWAAVLFGVALAGAVMFTPLVLVVGAFLAAVTLLHLAPRAERRARALQTGRLVAVVAAVFVGIFLSLHALTGFDLIATYREVLGSKHDWSPELTRQELLGRPYWKAVISDPWEFLLGTGWVIGLLALLRAVDALRDRKGLWALELLALAQIGLMPLLSFVRGESARLWLFLVPLLALPAGIELARWNPRQRAAAFAGLFLVLTSIYLNMRFVSR